MRLFLPLLIAATACAQEPESTTTEKIELPFDSYTKTLDYVIDGMQGRIDSRFNADQTSSEMYSWILDLKSSVKLGLMQATAVITERQEEIERLKEECAAPSDSGLGDLSTQVRALIERLKKCEAGKTGDAAIAAAIAREQAVCVEKLEDQRASMEKDCQLSTDALEEEVEELKEQLAQPQQGCEAVENDLDACKIARKQEGQQANEEIQKLNVEIQAKKDALQKEILQCADKIVNCDETKKTVETEKQQAEAQLGQCSTRLQETDDARVTCEAHSEDVQRSIDRLAEELEAATASGNAAWINSVRVKWQSQFARLRSVESRLHSFHHPRAAATLFN